MWQTCTAFQCFLHNIPTWIISVSISTFLKIVNQKSGIPWAFSSKTQSTQQSRINYTFSHHTTVLSLLLPKALFSFGQSIHNGSHMTQKEYYLRITRGQGIYCHQSKLKQYMKYYQNPTFNSAISNLDRGLQLNYRTLIILKNTMKLQDLQKHNQVLPHVTAETDWLLQ